MQQIVTKSLWSGHDQAEDTNQAKEQRAVKNTRETFPIIHGCTPAIRQLDDCLDKPLLHS